MGKPIEFDLYEQRISSTCGAAVLVMVYQSRGFTITEEQITADMQLTDDGAGWDQMHSHVTKNGFNTKFERDARYEDLMGYIYPIVCFVSDRDGEPDYHFSVVYQMDDDSITVADPEFGDTMTYSRTEFVKNWHDEEGRRTFLAIVGQRSPSSFK